MQDLGELLAKKARVHLNGQAVEFRELTLADYAEFVNYVKARHSEEQQRQRDDLMQAASKIKGLDPTELLRSLQKPLTDDEVDAAMGSIDGMTYLVWLSVKTDQPDVTREELAALIPLSGLQTITAAIVSTSGLKGLGVNGDDAGKKKP